jgi:flavin-dependent dehydrogenase
VKPIHIIGGGLAGLTLGIALRKKSVPVTISEAGDYPRHRVCGEFISGRGVEVLSKLGLLEALTPSTCKARTAAFFLGDRMIGVRPLPQEALCISRHVLDATLAREFVSAGGTLRTGQREEARAADGIVLATGRRARPVDSAGARWFGLKIHARNVPLEADLEMHVDRDTYVGLCRLKDHTVNVCGLFRRAAAEPARVDALRGRAGSLLAKKMERAELDEDSFCAVAGLYLEPATIDRDACRIGDALTMIPPITGNGMSMAFECAAIATEPLESFARDEQSWSATARAIGHQLHRAFAPRLRWARRFHRALFMDLGRARALPLLMRHRWTWTAAFELTRR